MVVTEAWIWRSWFAIPVWLWISINIGALLAASVISTIVFYGTIYVFRDSLSIFLNILAAIIAFCTTISLIHWLILRQQIVASVFWSIANVIGGFFIWVLLQILVSFTTYYYWKLLLLSIFAGATVGLVIATLINFWGRP